MKLDLAEQEIDYLYRCLMGRPMGEVEALVIKIRKQVTAVTDVRSANDEAPAGLSEAEDLPALP